MVQKALGEADQMTSQYLAVFLMLCLSQESLFFRSGCWGQPWPISFVFNFHKSMTNNSINKFINKAKIVCIGFEPMAAVDERRRQSDQMLN